MVGAGNSPTSLPFIGLSAPVLSVKAGFVLLPVFTWPPHSCHSEFADVCLRESRSCRCVMHVVFTKVYDAKTKTLTVNSQQFNESSAC